MNNFIVSIKIPGNVYNQDIHVAADSSRDLLKIINDIYGSVQIVSFVEK